MTDKIRYVPEMWTPKIDSHLTNLHIKKPRTTVNYRIGSRKRAISQSHIPKVADKKIAFNKGRLHFMIKFVSHIDF